MSERRPSPELFPALLTTVAWAALSFASIGLLSWALDRDPVERPVGASFGFVALGLSGLLVWLVSAFTARAPRPWLGMLGAAAGCYLVVCAAAFSVGFGLLIEQATSPFLLVASLLAPGGVALCWAMVRHTPRSRG